MIVVQQSRQNAQTTLAFLRQSSEWHDLDRDVPVVDPLTGLTFVKTSLKRREDGWVMMADDDEMGGDLLMEYDLDLPI